MATISYAAYAELRREALASMQEVRNFIDGRFTEGPSGQTFESVDPATNEPIATVYSAGQEGVELAVAAARRAFDEGPWPRLPAAERARALRRIAELIRQRADDWRAPIPGSRSSRYGRPRSCAPPTTSTSSLRWRPG